MWLYRFVETIKELPRAWLSYCYQFRIYSTVHTYTFAVQCSTCKTSTICKEADADARSGWKAIESYHVLGTRTFFSLLSRLILPTLSSGDCIEMYLALPV